jgi:hypothetical protein
VKNFTKSNLRKIEDNWDNIKIYLATTTRLVAKFGFRWENIVAPLALLPIAFWLMKHGEDKFDKSSKQSDVTIQTAIKRWLTIALLKNAFGGSSDTTLKNLRDTLLTFKKFDSFPGDRLNEALEIQAQLSDDEISDLVRYKYQGKYTYLILSLLYPDRDWKDTVFHEDHIFPDSTFGTRALRKRDYSKEKIERYQALYNTVLNLELLTDTENISKNATPFDKWISTRDQGFKNRHLIPQLKSYDLDDFENFIEARRKLIVQQLKSL